MFVDLLIKVEDYNVMWELVCVGLGIGLCDECIGDKDFDVVWVLNDLLLILFLVWMLVYWDVKYNKWVRYVFDYLICELGMVGIFV